MICAHCGERIDYATYPGTWLALLPTPGESPEDVPRFHAKRTDCKAAAHRSAAARGELTREADLRASRIWA